MKLQILKPMNSAPPYDQDSGEWHTWLDCCSVGVKMQPGEILDVEKMMRAHGTDEKYYDNYLGPLLEDGYLKVIED